MVGTEVADFIDEAELCSTDSKKKRLQDIIGYNASGAPHPTPLAFCSRLVFCVAMLI